MALCFIALIDALYLSSMPPLVYFHSTGHQPMWPHPSNTQSQEAPQASTQAPVLLNMVLMVRGSTWGLTLHTERLTAGL